MTNPTPAIVTQSAVRRLPRVALWLFCLAYVLPGLLGREPWKGNEVTAFGQMLALSEGVSARAYLAAVLPYLLRKRSTRPPMLSTDFWVPV